MSGFLRILFVGLVALVIGCGGSSSTAPQGVKVGITFVGFTPSVVATQIGTEPFMPASLIDPNLLGLVLPNATTNYAVAYVCPSGQQEFVLEANAQDFDKLAVNCPNVFQPPVAAAATGSVNASAIPGATQVIVANALSPVSLGVSGSFSALLPSGTRDIGFLAENASGVVLGVKILRSQTVPGAVNGGATVVFAPTDTTTQQPIIIGNVPSGSAFGLTVAYDTIGGAGLLLNGSTNSYSAVPATETQGTDVYFYQSTATVTGSEVVGVLEATTSGGGPVTLTLPVPWSFSGPAPAALPTFTFNYSGFAGLPAVSQEAAIAWTTPTSVSNSIMVTATANFQNGATTLTFPDLTSLGGFLSAPSGAQISWSAQISGGTAQVFDIALPGSQSVGVVQNKGTYTQP